MIRVDGNQFIIENDLFLRELTVDSGGLRTSSVLNKKDGCEYERRPNEADFQVSLNSQVVVSFNKPEVHILDGNIVEHEKVLEFEDYKINKGDFNSEILELNFLCSKYNVRIKVYYQIYPDLPGCVKWMKFECLKGELHLNRLFFEVLNTDRKSVV